MQFWSKAKEPVGNGEGSGRRSNGEVTVLLLNRRDGIAPATHTYALDDRRMSAVGGIIPLLEKDEAIRLEFICLPVHLPGKHWPTVAMETEDDPFSPCQSSEEPAWLYLDSSWGMMARACDTTPKLTICGVLARNGGRSTAWIDPWDRECFITSASDEWSGFPVACLACSRHSGPTNSPTWRSRYLEAEMPVYRAYIVGLHDRSIGVVQMDCIDDDSAIKSAKRLVDSHDVELWQVDRPVARFDAPSKQIFKK